MKKISRKTRKKLLWTFTIFEILLGLFLIYGWFDFLFDAIQDFSNDKLKPLISIPIGLAALAIKLRRAWAVFEITEIIGQNEEKKL